MSERAKGWTRGHSGWAGGTVLLFAAGILFGLIWGNVWLGIILAAAISIGWLIAYESSRGRNVGIYDRDDDGAQL
ncbi:hypothetical protein Q9S36_10170 [Microbacterium sp. ARD31]|jgi:hypothetical protein|uniref:hypothetical protein n=1 Tax=unclassified Microbacterium TaxID=2609290 RepID=UPI00203DAB80|nr:MULTISPECIES: hypothetical protein [unclassified Microbacterium]MDT0180568.1 hypothetical protein [Microbacterium sp. ARD31]